MKWALRITFLALCAVAFLQPSPAQVAVTVSIAPPALPVYDLPPCPGDGYLWTPGYWAWDPDYDYYWVPGTWVMAPEPGLLWTPGWWGWGGAGFIFHDGFWGPEVGFYGGIDYGFGYFGLGFVGGRWDGGIFRYNTAVLNVNTTIIHNTYNDRTVIENRTDNHVSYNGGQGGISARPTPEQQRIGDQHHIAPTREQQQHIQAARENPDMRASQNHGRPSIAATSRPGDFHEGGSVATRDAGAPYHAPATAGRSDVRPVEGAGSEGAPTHAKDLKAHTVGSPNTGDAKLDKKYEKQQQKLVDKENKEHQQLEQRQQKEDNAAQKRNWNQDRTSQMEQRHQQQTQQMEERHSTQMNQLRQQQAPAGRPR